MDIAAIDQVRLNFNPQGLLVINGAIGLMMFGVALDLKLEDFKRVVVAPKAPGIGLAVMKERRKFMRRYSRLCFRLPGESSRFFFRVVR